MSAGTKSASRASASAPRRSDRGPNISAGTASSSSNLAPLIGSRVSVGFSVAAPSRLLSLMLFGRLWPSSAQNHTRRHHRRDMPVHRMSAVPAKNVSEPAGLRLGCYGGSYSKNGRPGVTGTARFLTARWSCRPSGLLVGGPEGPHYIWSAKTSFGNRSSAAARPGSGSAGATAVRTCC